MAGSASTAVLLPSTIRLYFMACSSIAMTKCKCGAASGGHRSPVLTPVAGLVFLLWLRVCARHPAAKLTPLQIGKQREEKGEKREAPNKSPSLPLPGERGLTLHGALGARRLRRRSASRC